MKKPSNLFSVILLFGLILAACTSAAQPTEPPAGVSAATEAPADVTAPIEPPATELAAAEPAVVQPEAGAQHVAAPGEPPTSGGEKWGDHSTLSSLSAGRALLGDRFSNGKFERPYNANTMDVYFQHLDIDRIVIHPEDPTWVYAVVGMVGRDANNSFTGQYAIELDLDRNGYGEFLIMADNPASTDWTTEGVRVFKDANGDIGGVKPVNADSAGAGGDGYETVLFDQGSGDDPDLAWVRLDPDDPNGFQIAYKQSLLGGVTKYTAGLWAGTSLNPALFDYNDHLTHEQAGAGDVNLANFYPIKELSEFDNTCRQAIGYDASGLEPGICPVQ